MNSFKQGIKASADSLSDVLVKFYRDNNLLNLESQLQLTIAALAGHEEQIQNLKISESKSGTDNSTAAELRKRRYILEKEAQKLRGDFSEDYVPNKNSVYINSDWAVEKLIEQEKLESDLKRIFATLEIVEGNIVMEEGNAAKNLPVIQIVQDAYLADYKSKPKRVLWSIAAFAIAFILVSVFFIVRGITSGELETEKERREKIRKFLNSLKI